MPTSHLWKIPAASAAEAPVSWNTCKPNKPYVSKAKLFLWTVLATAAGQLLYAHSTYYLNTATVEHQCFSISVQKYGTRARYLPAYHHYPFVTAAAVFKLRCKQRLLAEADSLASGRKPADHNLTSVKCFGAPAPLLAITGIVTARDTASTSAKSKPCRDTQVRRHKLLKAIIVIPTN